MASGREKMGAPVLKNHAGMPSRPAVVDGDGQVDERPFAALLCGPT